MTLERGDTPTFMAKDDFINFMSTDTAQILDAKGKPVKVPKAKLWLAHPRRRSYRGIGFKPGEEDTSPILNLWTGWNVDPDKAVKGSCRGWLDLLYYVICGSDDRLYNWMLNWFANIVREPQRKLLTAPVLIGKEGAGKTLLIEYFGQMLGRSYVVVTKEDHIYGKFNNHMGTCLLLHSEEALYGGDQRHASIIRDLITGNTAMFEKKGVDAKQITSYLRLIMASNKIQAAPVAVDDRRYNIIDMEYRIVPEKIRDETVAEKENGGPSALFKYLTEDFDYDPNVARFNIKNDAMLDLKIINADPAIGWWYETLRMGMVLPDFLSWATKPAGAEWPNVVSSSALYLSHILHCRARNRTYVLDTTGLALALNRMVGMKLEREQKYYANPMADDAPREVKLLPQKQYSITNLPSLEACRHAFETYMGGQKIKWPKEVLEDKEKPMHLRY